MNLRELEYLVALADTGHFGQAAQACGVSQPTLSAQIRRLEDDLGVTLVARGRRAELTAAGVRVTELARQMLALSDDIHATARECAGQPAPPLRVGVFPTLAPYLAGPLLRGIAAQQSDLQIVIAEQPTNDLLTMLEQRAVDVALIATPVTPMLSRIP
ncbi:MAG: LysR family transcriptional regulator, partial [Cutibacterium sp.]|nr:LysR family transcriptional regulator [Cutibacterium sp.]